MAKYNKRQIIIESEFAKVPLTNGHFAIIDLEDISKVDVSTWCSKDDKQYNYAVAKISGKKIYLHRLIMGLPPKNIFIDHINHNTLDNRKANLRFCTRAQNRANSKSKKQYTGITKYDREYLPFRGRVTKDGKVYSTQCFATLEEVLRARDELALKIHGEFAFLNLR